MKKVTAIVLISFALVGCASNLDEVEDTTSSFELVSDPDTKVVYIKNYTKGGYSVFTPYYSANGKLCRYEDNALVEIDTDEENE